MRSFYLQYIKNNRLHQLIAVNVIVFLLVNLLDLFSNWSLGHGGGVVHWLAGPARLGVLILKPWTVLTHMFTHENLGHLFFNMLVLYFMGSFFTQIQGAKKLTWLYLLAGLSGYLFFMLVFGLTGDGQPHAVIGASAAAMGIVVATAVLRPLQPIHLFGVVRMELRWMAAIMVFMDLMSIKEGVNSGGHVGHLGGALFGLYYGYTLSKGTTFPWEAWLKNWTSKSRMKVKHTQGRSKSDEQFNTERNQRNKKTDAILDKIARSGYESLSKEEKEFLFNQAQK
jgi:membrane associated rhomboid family serine protease